MKFGCWEYAYNDFYTKWINVCRPPQFIFNLNEDNFKLIISDDKNEPENNFIVFNQDLNTDEIDYEFVDKYNHKLKQDRI